MPAKPLTKRSIHDRNYEETVVPLVRKQEVFSGGQLFSDGSQPVLVDLVSNSGELSQMEVFVGEHNCKDLFLMVSISSGKNHVENYMYAIKTGFNSLSASIRVVAPVRLKVSLHGQQPFEAQDIMFKGVLSWQE